jgi:hypothetical protein
VANLIKQGGFRMPRGGNTRWKPGQSGNPKGRPPGTGEVGKLRAAIGQAVPGILAALIERAQAGDVQAARLLLERVLPAARPVELPEAVPLQGETLTEQGQSVLRLLAAGELGPGQAAGLLGAIGALARVTELDELSRRIEALERGQTGKEIGHDDFES